MKGLLLINTGSPKSPRPGDVRAFIEAMLSDPLVMTVPDWFRPILVKGIIGPFRQFSSAKKYDLIWDKEQDKSPLLYHAEELAFKIEKLAEIPVEIGMTYLEPSITDGLSKLHERCNTLSEVIVLPLFPHYAESSFRTAVEQVKVCYKKEGFPFQLRIIEPYFKHPEYIKALAQKMRSYMKEDYDRIVFNFHSLPLSHVEKGVEKGIEFDYVYQAKETVKLLAHELNIAPVKIRVVYSSAFGRNWLEPSLDDQVKEMAQSGNKEILIVSPGFAADNLETLYDIDIKAREIFMSNGGKELVYVPCLNSESYWAEAIQRIIL